MINAFSFYIYKRDNSFHIHKRATTFSSYKDSPPILLDIILDLKFDFFVIRDFTLAIIRFTTTFNILRAFLNTKVSDSKISEIRTSDLCKLRATCLIAVRTGFEIESYIAAPKNIIYDIEIDIYDSVNNIGCAIGKVIILPVSDRDEVREVGE